MTSNVRSGLCALLLLGAGVVIPACSDNTTVTTPDGGSVLDGTARGDSSVDANRRDTGPMPDTGVRVDMGMRLDGGAGNDAFMPGNDAFMPGNDAFMPGNDAFVPGNDAFVPPVDTGVDAFVPPPVDMGVDAFVPGNDAFVPPPVDMGVDAFVPPPVDMGVDAFVPPVDAYVPRCGNLILDPTEDCDDGNTRNLDGCDSGCHYEAFSRLTDLQIATGAAPPSCTPTTNQLGAVALSATAVNQLNPALRTAVQNGSLNVLMQALGLVDLNGVDDPSFTLGVMNGAPDPAAGAWPAAGNPIDWRFYIDNNGVTTMGLPVATMPGSIVANALTGGPATVTLPLALGGSVANLTLLDTRVIGTVGATTSVPPYPTSLRPTVTTFETITGNAAGEGLCGNITVQSLAQIPAPMQLTTGFTRCSQGYTYCGMGLPVTPSCNSLLDVLVGGCRVIFANVINPTQPDVAGPGGLFPLTSGAGRRVTVPPNDNDAYSAFFTFTANRAHASAMSCTMTSQCQAGQTCMGVAPNRTCR